MNTICEPKAVEDVHGDGRWMSMHKRFIEDGKLLRPEVVFTGDSLIHRMQDTETWEKMFKPMKAVNFGIGGDKIENVLWRLQNGELESVKPKLFVVLVGTNNIDNTCDEIVEGLETIAWTINQRHPQTKILILGLLPRGEKPNRLRDKHYEINNDLERSLQAIPNTWFLKADPGFVNSNGFIKMSDMNDYLHLTRAAYAKFGRLVCSFILKLLD
eukprot:Seg7544.1 transcript_id=Seg7544.1/GoldUCD/mRNA.D3Y31 product="Platelet-activating factor acetylhydrolase IB subunit beta" protein_id=Seg7544.1/GoldUCD/D3Y31